MPIPCPTNCTPEQLIGLPTSNCDTGFRRDTPSRFFAMNCDMSLPTGSMAVVGAAALALFNSGDMVSTMQLANIVFEDPTYEEVQLNDCVAADSLLQTRAVTFEDRNAIDISNISPFVNDKFFDYDFWVDKLANQKNIRWFLAYCSGDVRQIEYVGTLRGFVDYLKAQTAGGKSTEIKKFRLLFNGDPLEMTSKPIFNYIDAGIVL